MNRNLLFVTGLTGLLLASGLAPICSASVDVFPMYPAVVQEKGTAREVKASLVSIVREVVRRNPSIMSDFLQTRVSKESVRGERGIYDPTFQSTLTTQNTKVQNNAADILVRSATNYEELNNALDLGISGLAPSGAQWDFKFTNTQDNSTSIDNIRGYRYEYNGILKLSVEQPLLKGFGRKATEAKINMATIQSDVDYGKFEQRVMELIGVTIQVYWKLYGAQQIYTSWLNSVKIAEETALDIEQRVAAGKIANTELMEAHNALHQRKTELYAARSKVVEAQTQLYTLLNLDYSRMRSVQLLAADDPNANGAAFRDLDYYLKSALAKWPEYQNAKRQVQKELVEVEFAANQARPQFSFVGSVGTSSLDHRYDGAYRYLADDQFLSWSAGLKFSMPIGNKQASSALESARLRLEQARVELDGLEKSLSNSTYSKLEAARSLQEQLKEFELGLDIRAKVLALEQERLKAGRVSQKALLAQEEEYVLFQRKLMSCFVYFKSAEAALEISSMDIFAKYGIDIAKYPQKVSATEDRLPWE